MTTNFHPRILALFPDQTDRHEENRVNARWVWRHYHAKITNREELAYLKEIRYGRDSTAAREALDQSTGDSHLSSPVERADDIATLKRTVTSIRTTVGQIFTLLKDIRDTLTKWDVTTTTAPEQTASPEVGQNLTEISASNSSAWPLPATTDPSDAAKLVANKWTPAPEVEAKP